MNDNALQSRIAELQQDLKANQLQLSSERKKNHEFENEISSLKEELSRKNKEMDEMRITSKISTDHRFDEMHLEIEEYKNQIQLKESEKQQLQNENILLRRQCQTMKSQLDSLSFKYNQNENEYNLRITRLDTMYKQKIETLKRLNESQIKIYQDKMEAIKHEQFLLSNKETEDIKNSLNELRNSHDQIEADLNAQIEDLKDQMNKREKEKEELITEMKQLNDKYKQHAEQQILELQNKLQRYEEGDVEIVLKIEVDDPIIHKPPPKKPAPPKPNGPPSRRSSNASLRSINSAQSFNRNISNLSIPIITDTGSADVDVDDEENGVSSPVKSENGNYGALTLQNIKSNPEFWSGDHSNPNGFHHKASMQQMRILDVDDEDDDDSDDEEHDDDDDDDSKDSKSDDSMSDNRLYPTSTILETKSTPNLGLNGRGNGNEEKKDKLRISLNKTQSHNGYVSRRKSKNYRRLSLSHLKETQSANSRLSSSPYTSSRPKTPTFYIFRKMADQNKELNGHFKENQDKSYSANLAQKYEKMNGASQSNSNSTSTSTSKSTSHKYTDSAIGIIKSMWGTKTNGAQTPTVTRNGKRNWLSSAHSVNGGFPSPHYRQKREKNRSVGSFNSDLFSDNLSVASSTLSGMDRGGASSVKLSPNEALSSKSLELQREMYRQANNRLAEDLKNANKKIMVVRQQAHRKYKQLQIQMQAEQRQWKIREKELSDKIQKQSQTTKQNELIITKLKKEFTSLQAEYNMRIQQHPQQQPPNQQQQQQQSANMQALMMKIQSLEQNNKSLIGETEKYRRELSGLKKTVISSSDTMRQQQQQILILNTQISELRKLNGLGGSSSEELLMKQIRLLKSQRRMLVKELKELREQNEQLKNIIVTGGNR